MHEGHPSGPVVSKGTSWELAQLTKLHGGTMLLHTKPGGGGGLLAVTSVKCVDYSKT